MNTNRHGPDLLQENRGVLKSRMGTFYPGSHVIFRGHDLHRDLKDMDWFELYFFSITGRSLSPEQLRLMQAIWIYTSYPDVRLWNNRVAALASSTRSTGVLGLGAALAVSEAEIYGGGTYIRAINFLIRTRQRLDDGTSLSDCIREELNTHRIMKGYGRPIINGDERIPHLLALAHSLELDQGPHLRLAFAIEEALRNIHPHLRMNYVGLIAGLAADNGLSPREFYLLLFPMFLAGMTPGYIEASEHPEGTLYPTACIDVLYEGQSARKWKSRGK